MMDKTMEHVQKWPTIEYFPNDNLVVDRAWVESKENQLLVELEGCFFTIPLDRARMGEGRALDEGDLISAGRSEPLEEAWPLTDGSIQSRYRICLRETKECWLANYRRKWMGPETPERLGEFF